MYLCMYVCKYEVAKFRWKSSSYKSYMTTYYKILLYWRVRSSHFLDKVMFSVEKWLNFYSHKMELKVVILNEIY